MTYAEIMSFLKQADWAPKVIGAKVIQGISERAPTALGAVRKAAPQLPLAAIQEMGQRKAQRMGQAALPAFSNRSLSPGSFNPFRKTGSADFDYVVMAAFRDELEKISSSMDLSSLLLDFAMPVA